MATIPNFEWIETSYRDGVTEWHCYVGQTEIGKVIITPKGKVKCTSAYIRGYVDDGCCMGCARSWVESKWKDFHKVSE